MSRFRVTRKFFDKGTKWPQNWPWNYPKMILAYSTMFQGQKYPYAYHITPPTHTQNFIYFALRWAVFELRPTFGKWTEWPKWAWHVEGQKYPYGYYTPPRAHIFIHFALWWAVFKLRPNFGKSAPHYPKMTLTCSRSKVPICILRVHKNPRSNFSSVSLYDEQFWGKATRNHIGGIISKIIKLEGRTPEKKPIPYHDLS